MVVNSRTSHIANRPNSMAKVITLLIAVSIALMPWMLASQTPESVDPPPPVEETIPVDQEQNPEPDDPPVTVPDPDQPEDPPVTDPVDPIDPPVTEPDPADPPVTEPDPVDPADPPVTEPDPVDSADPPATDPDPVDSDDPDAVSVPEPKVEPSLPSTPEGSDDSSLGQIKAPSTPESDLGEDTGTEEDNPVASPTAEPTPTQTPTPVVTWSQSNPVRCALQQGSESELEKDESSTYECVAEVSTSIEGDTPGDMQVKWSIDLDFPETSQLVLPAGSKASIESQQPGAAATSTNYVVGNPWEIDSDVQQLAFNVVITRATCAFGDQLLTVQAAPGISTLESEAEIMQEGSLPAAAQATTTFSPNLSVPEVSMTPVNFGTLHWNGNTWGTSVTTSTITLTSDGCETSTPYEVTVEVVATDPGLEPVIAQVGEGSQGIEPAFATEGVADTATIATIPAGFSGEGQINVDFALSPAFDSDYGQHNFEFVVTVSAVPD